MTLIAYPKPEKEYRVADEDAARMERAAKSASARRCDCCRYWKPERNGTCARDGYSAAAGDVCARWSARFARTSQRCQSLSVIDAADELGVPYDTMVKWVQLGCIDANKVGGRWEIPAAAVRDLKSKMAASYTTAQAAKELGVSQNDVTEMARDGRIRAFKPLKAHWRIPVEEVERLKGEMARE